jgi:hypothetical protein
MKFIVELGGKRAEELHMSTWGARQQLDNALKGHAARGHFIAQSEEDVDVSSHFIVVTPRGKIEYWLEQ